MNVNKYTKLSKRVKFIRQEQTRTALAALGLASLVTGCSTALAQTGEAPGLPANNLPASSPNLPTSIPSPTPLTRQTASDTILLSTAPPLLSPTAWPTPTPWPTPVAWRPATPTPLPTLAPIPVVNTTTGVGVVSGSLPVSYSPPNGVDVFGGTILRWTYYGQLAEDEYFDIRIKPQGSNDSAFVDWTRSMEYELRPWSGWKPGVYTWEIGIIKGYREGETKHFIADTGRVSQPFIIKWQVAGGGGGGGGGGGSGGGGGGTGGGGGGGASGGS